jgi:hypothetical protein
MGTTARRSSIRKTDKCGRCERVISSASLGRNQAVIPSRADGEVPRSLGEPAGRHFAIHRLSGDSGFGLREQRSPRSLESAARWCDRALIFRSRIRPPSRALRLSAGKTYAVNRLDRSDAAFEDETAFDPEMRLDFVYFEKRNRYLAAVRELFRRLVFRLLQKRKVVAVAFFLQLFYLDKAQRR